MTRRPNLDWLADDEGNLTAEVARVLQGGLPQAEEPRAARPQSAPPAPARATAQPMARQPIPRVVVPAHWMPVVVIGAALIGLVLGRWSGSRSSHPDAVPNFAEVPAAAIPPVAPAADLHTAVVNAVNVNLRVGPGLDAPVQSELTSGEIVRLGVEHDGWFAVETSSGVKGFVFGAFLRGAGSNEGQPAAMTTTLRSVANGAELDLQPGDRVLAQHESESGATILLPSGFHLRVPQNALAFLD